MHYPDRSTVCVSHPGRLRDGLRLLRHRPGRLRAPPHGGRDRRAGGAGRPRRGRRPAPGGSRTSCSWAWASRSPTTTASWAAIERIHDDLGLSARHLTALDRRASSPASGAWPPRTCRSTWPCRCTPPTTSCATSWCRSTGATRSTTLDDACARLPARPSTAGSRSSGRSSTASTTGDATPTSWPRSPAALRGPREPHPAEPHPGWPTTGIAARAGRGLPRPAAATWASTPPCGRNRGTEIDAACGQLRAEHEVTLATRPAGERPEREPRRVARTERTRTSSGPTVHPGHTTESSTRPSTTAPAPTTLAPTTAPAPPSPWGPRPPARRRMRPGSPRGTSVGVPQSTKGPSWRTTSSAPSASQRRHTTS